MSIKKLLFNQPSTPIFIKELSNNSIFPFVETPENSIFNPIGWKQCLLLFATCCCFSIMILAILFRINYWAGASLLLSISIILSILISIPVTIQRLKSASLFYKQIHLRMSILLIICITVLLIPTKVLMNIQYRNHPEILQQRLDAASKQIID